MELSLVIAADNGRGCTLQRLALRFEVDVGLNDAQDVNVSAGGLADTRGEFEAELGVGAATPGDEYGAYFV